MMVLLMLWMVEWKLVDFWKTSDIKPPLCFCLLYRCEQSAFWLPAGPKKTLDIKNIFPFCRLNIIKLISRLQEFKN